MKKLSLFVLVVLSIVSCTQNQVNVTGTAKEPVSQLVDTADNTNNFYDNTETIPLPGVGLTIDGEIENPGKVDFSTLPVHSVIVKETLLDSAGSDRFVGAYRYDGYSLFDILNSRKISKSNSKEFNPIIDLYVEIVNAKGEKVVFSWGEIFYPNNLHKIIIAGSVSRIVPSKIKDLWPLPATFKIVAGCDLITERNITDPVKITVRSFPKSFAVDKGLSPMYSADFKLFKNDEQIDEKILLDEKNKITFNTIFYGRGKGIHSTSPFTGLLLKDVISKYYPPKKTDLQTGILCLVGKDGYRCAISFSELFNRNDQQEFLLVKSAPAEEGGLYRVFAACDFFSDRAIKSLSEIHLID
jgi:hypothetical protein